MIMTVITFLFLMKQRPNCMVKENADILKMSKSMEN